MRIVVINPHMRREYSGPTLLMHRLFGRIASNSGFEVDVLGPEEPASRTPELNYHILTPGQMHTAMGQLGWIMKGSIWILRRRRSIDYVHLHGAYSFNVAVAAVLVMLRIPYGILPLSASGDLASDARTMKIPGVAWAKRAIISRAHAGYALSADNADELLHWGMGKDAVHRLNNPAPSNYFTPPSESPNVPQQMIFMGKLGPRKRPDLLILALQILRHEWPLARAVLLGPYEDIEYARAFERLVVEAGLREWVEVRGYVADVAEELGGLRGVFVLASSQEGLPGALTEAMALGMPVVVTDVGAMGEVVEESGAGSVVVPEAAAIAAIVSQFWGEPGRYNELARNAYKYAQDHYSVEAVSTAYLRSIDLKGRRR